MRKRLAFLSATTAIAALCPLTARSQTSSAPTASAARSERSDTRTETSTADIVVTAQFRETNLQETPLAISAISGAALTERGLTDVISIAQTAPSVTLAPAPSAFGKTTVSFIRGVGAADFNPAFDPSVGFYVDDIYYASLAGSTFDLLDLERVEVLRGPQGTLFGKNTIGGAIRLISTKPSGTLGGSVEATYGSYDRFDVRGSLNIPLAGDNLAVRVSGVHKQRRGYMKRVDFACANPTLAGSLPRIATGNDCVVGHDGGENVDAFRAALRAVPVEGMEINIAGDYTKDRSTPGALSLLATGPDAALNGPGNPALGVFPINTYQFGPRFGVAYDDRFIPASRYTTYATYANPLTGESFDPVSLVRQYGFSGSLDFEFAENIKFRAITGYRNLLSKFVYDSDGSPLALVNQKNSVSYRQFSQELQLVGTAFNGGLDWVVGGYYFKGDADYNTITDLAVVGFRTTSANQLEVEDFSGFTHLTAHLTSRLNVTGGLRFTHETKDFALQQAYECYIPGGSGDRVPFPFCIPPIDVTAPQLAYSRWDPKISVDYKISDEVMAYAQFSSGFRGGGRNNRPFTPSQVFPVDPEKLQAYELGIKSQFFDRKVTANVTLFQSDYSDIQQIVQGIDTFGTSFSAPLNVGNARIRGIELEGGFRLSGLNISFNANYLDAKITKGRAPGNGLTVPASSLPQKGASLGFAPKWRVNLGAQYEFDLGPIGTLTPRADLNYQSSIKYDATTSPLSVEGGYALVNARLTWADHNGLSVAAGVTNVFDKFYNAYIFNTFVQGLGSLNATPSRPREWSVTVRKTF